MIEHDVLELHQAAGQRMAQSERGHLRDRSGDPIARLDMRDRFIGRNQLVAQLLAPVRSHLYRGSHLGGLLGVIAEARRKLANPHRAGQRAAAARGQLDCGRAKINAATCGEVRESGLTGVTRNHVSPCGSGGSNPPLSANESFSVCDSATDDRNTRLCGLFRTARGSGERDQPDKSPIRPDLSLF